VEKGLGDKIAYYWVGNDPKDKGQVRKLKTSLGFKHCDESGSRF
jgi:hypothetical protein